MTTFSRGWSFRLGPQVQVPFESFSALEKISFSGLFNQRRFEVQKCYKKRKFVLYSFMFFPNLLKLELKIFIKIYAEIPSESFLNWGTYKQSSGTFGICLCGISDFGAESGRKNVSLKWRRVSLFSLRLFLKFLFLLLKLVLTQSRDLVIMREFANLVSLFTHIEKR